MYTSAFTTLTDEAGQRELVRRVGVGQLVTVGDDGFPQATLLPLLWDNDRVTMHAARVNPQFSGLVGRSVPALLVITGPNAYVSPRWYATQARRGLAVPTWNYQAVQLRGTLTAYDDHDRLLVAVTALSDAHEARRPQPWTLGDAPAYLVQGFLRGIVGLELQVTAVKAKAKLSQNRVAADRLGVIEALRAEPGGPGSGPFEVAEAMAATMRTQPPVDRA